MNDVFDKSHIREKQLHQRLQQSTNDVLSKSSLISKKALALPEVNSKHVFCCYISVHQEVDTKDIIDTLLIKKVLVSLPYYSSGEHTYALRLFSGWSNLEKGPFDILQPRESSSVNPHEVELAFFPGLAFSKRGVRLGYGKGVYDNLFSTSSAFKIGLAYDFQIEEEIPEAEHDVRMDVVITEKRILRFKN